MIYFEKVNVKSINHKLCNVIYGKTLHNITVKDLNSKSSGVINSLTRCFTLYERSTGNDVIIKTFDNFAFEIIKGSLERRFYYISNQSLYF